MTALAAFDVLGACTVITEAGKELTFAQFYQEVFDRPFASALLAELLQLEDVERDGNKCAAAYQKQAITALAAWGLAGSLTDEQRLLVTYCFYWWGAFVKGYIAEIATFRDLQNSGIRFQPHDLTQPAERFSFADLTLSEMQGDIKSSTYFLHTARHFPLKHDFYIAAIFDAQSRQQRRIVIMQAAAWDRIDGDTLAVPLTQLTESLAQPVNMTVIGQRLIVAEYELWKAKIRAFQQRGNNHE